MTLSQAQQLDLHDPLANFRNQFYIPQYQNQDLVYLVGNSLGLQTKNCKNELNLELEKWQNLGVEAWFEGQNPWIPYHEILKKPLCRLLGARETEITVMNSLTVNLQLMLMSFYKPNQQKFKILCETGAFPSDQYALESHLKARGLDPEQCLIEINPDPTTGLLRTDDILEAVNIHQNELALIMLGGVNYYTGQVLAMQKITKLANDLDITIGFDLAHAIGNVPLQLHDWGIDFAVWCSYKYLNTGPGGIAGAFIHQKHHDKNLERLAGWWGYDQATRFEMTKGFVPMQGADGWQLSTPNILAMASHKAALNLFELAGFENLLLKSEQLHQYLREIIEQYPQIEILTPKPNHEHGCQLSLLINENGKEVFEQLKTRGIWGDWREPNCIRLSPVPLYNSFLDIYKVGKALESIFNGLTN